MASYSGPGARQRAGRGATAFKAVAYALLLGECVVILIPTVYGRAAPRLFGIPFFYWFQLLWIIVGMFVTGIAYLLVEHVDRTSRRAAAAGSGSAPIAGGNGR